MAVFLSQHLRQTGWRLVHPSTISHVVGTLAYGDVRGDGEVLNSKNTSQIVQDLLRSMVGPLGLDFCLATS